MFRPIDDKVLVLPIDEEKSAGGILIPESAQKAKRARVVAVGPGRRSQQGERMRPEVEPGDVVFLPEWGTSFSVTIAGKEHKVIGEEHLLGFERE